MTNNIPAELKIRFGGNSVVVETGGGHAETQATANEGLGSGDGVAAFVTIPDPLDRVAQPHISVNKKNTSRDDETAVVELGDSEFAALFARISKSHRETMMEVAIETMQEYMSAARQNDAECLLSILAEPEKSRATSEIRRRGLSYYVNYDIPIERWELHCTACWIGDAGTTCAIADRRYQPSKYNNKYDGGLYILKNDIGSSFYITGRPLIYGEDGRKVVKKMKKEYQVCDIYRR